MSKIEWTGDTLNCVVGCQKVSPGCQHCYAETMAGRLALMGQARYAAVVAGRRWTGGVRLVPEALRKPLRRHKPQTYFVCSMSDLFHADVPFAYIAAVFGVMAATPQHTYQLLTKRSARLRAFFTWFDTVSREGVSATPDAAIWRAITSLREYGIELSAAQLQAASRSPWPLPNVWLGVSAEDQQRADERIPLLLECPAAVRFVSAEPVLGPLDLERWLWCEPAPSTAGPWRDPLGRRVGQPGGIGGQQITARRAGLLHWCIAGGESGPGARPAHPDWFRELRDQCVSAGVPFFLKQWGAWAPWDGDCYELPAGTDDVAAHSRASWITPDGLITALERPGATALLRVGKKAAGRILDGRTWDEMPG